MEEKIWCRCRRSVSNDEKYVVGKVDDNTAMISTEVFNPDMVGQFMSSDEFKQMEKELGLSHEVYQLSKNWITL